MRLYDSLIRSDLLKRLPQYFGCTFMQRFYHKPDCQRLVVLLFNCFSVVLLGIVRTPSPSYSHLAKLYQAVKEMAHVATMNTAAYCNNCSNKRFMLKFNRNA